MIWKYSTSIKAHTLDCKGVNEIQKGSIHSEMIEYTVFFYCMKFGTYFYTKQ
jgi:hypothetical protein